MNAKKLLRRFKKDTGMNKAEYRTFCKRYSTRNMTTIIQFMREHYGALPKDIGKQLQAEMLTELKK